MAIIGGYDSSSGYTEEESAKFNKENAAIISNPQTQPVKAEPSDENDLYAKGLKFLASQGGGTAVTANSVMKINPSQEFYQAEAKKEIEKKAGESITKIETITSPTGKVQEEYFKGESGKVYHYSYTSGELSSIGNEPQRVSVMANNILITFSPAATEKVGGAEGLKQILYFSALQKQSQTVVDIAVKNAITGKGADVMLTPEEYAKYQAKEMMISERASRPETFAYYGMNVLKTAMIGLGATIALASGVPIENIRATEFEMRKQYVREHLADPIGRTAKEMFDIGSFMVLASPKTYSVAIEAIKNSAYAKYVLPAFKPVIIGTSVFIATKGAFETGGAIIDLATKEPNLISYTRLAGGLTMFAGGALGIYAGWKMPTYWSEIKWDEPIKSARITAQKVDMKIGKVIGKSEGLITEHGVSKAYYGLVKKEIWIKGFPETEFIGDLKTKITYATTWNPSVGVQQTFISKFQLGKESYFYPTGYSESIGFIIDTNSQGITIKTGKSFDDYLKGFKITYEKNGALFANKGAIAEVQAQDKEIFVNVKKLEKAPISFDEVLKHEVIHSVNPELGDKLDAMNKAGEWKKSIDISNKYPFEKSGTLTSLDFSSSKTIIIREISQNVIFEGTNIKTGYSYSISEPKLIKEITKELKPPTSTTIPTTKGGSITTYSFSDSQATEMIVKSLYETSSTSYDFQQFKEGEYKFSPLKQFEKSLVFSKEPIITSASGGGRGEVTISKPPTELTFGGGITFQPPMLKQFELTFRMTSTSLWKPFYSRKGTPTEQTYYIYPPSEKNAITQNLQNIQITMQKSIGSQKLQLNLEHGLKLETRLHQQLGLQLNLGLQTNLGLQNQLSSRTQSQTGLEMQQQLQLQQQLQQQLQLQHQTIVPKQTVKITPEVYFKLNTDSLKPRNIVIVTGKGFREPRILKISSFMKPTASLYSLERAAALYGRGSLARGKGIERVFRNLARSSGLSLEFPAAEFIKGVKL